MTDDIVSAINTYENIPELISKMWFEIAENIRASAEIDAQDGGYVSACRKARLAEAAYWQARGENSSFDFGHVAIELQIPDDVA